MYNTIEKAEPTHMHASCVRMTGYVRFVPKDPPNVLSLKYSDQRIWRVARLIVFASIYSLVSHHLNIIVSYTRSTELRCEWVLFGDAAF